LQPAIGAEAARWGDNAGTRMGTAVNYSKANWLTTRNTVQNSFLVNRPATALSQYRTLNLYPSSNATAPTFIPHGGALPTGGSVALLSPSPGTLYYTLDGSDPRLAGGTVNPAALTLGTGSNTTLLGTYDFGQPGWKYFTTAAAGALSSSEVVLGNASYNAGDWKHPDFVDTAWAMGSGMLGFGLFGTIITPYAPATLIPGGTSTNRNLTTYFRREFQLPDRDFATLQIDVLRDDGAILYLNGEEIGRTNIAAGTVTYSTLASDANPEEQMITFNLPANSPKLRIGRNVLAIEVHQATATSSDLAIDVKLSKTTQLQLAMNTSATLKSRLRTAGGEWSALNEATYVVNPANRDSLLISKIQYHPAPATLTEVAAGFSENDFEYLELFNYGGNAISLNGMKVSLAIDYTFPSTPALTLAPGERALLVANSAAFQTRYGSTPRIVGDFTGGGDLSNSGEEILFTSATNVEIWRFSWHDDGAWPASPDGEGKALVLINQAAQPSNANLSAASSWRPSVNPFGNPGTDDRRSLQSWLSQQASPSPDADPNQDGVAQSLAFATGALLHSDAQEYLPKFRSEERSVAEVSDMYLIIEMRILNGGTGFTAAVQNSNNLANWQVTPLILEATTDLGDGTLIQEYRTAQPIATFGPRRFHRLSVTPEP
jgi:hypothetical protein